MNKELNQIRAVNDRARANFFKIDNQVRYFHLEDTKLSIESMILEMACNIESLRSETEKLRQRVYKLEREDVFSS